MHQQDKIIESDVLVIGGGIAGCFAAIKASNAGARVVQVDKGHVGKSGSSVFAAGIMYIPFPEDTFIEDWIISEIRYLGYLALQERVEDHFGQAYQRVKDLEGYGAQFVKTPDGKIEREKGRGKFPIIMFPGPQLMDTLRRATVRSGVQQFHKTMITDLLSRDGRIVGAVGFNVMTGDFHVFKARATILATGLTQYKGLSPGHRDCTGDGFAVAYRAGAILSGADSEPSNFNSFPAHYDIGPGMSMYVGQGGRLVNGKGEEFMEKYHPTLKNRAPLAILTSAYGMEIRQGNGPIYMDLTHLPPEKVQKLRKTLPLPFRMYDRVGLVVGDRFTRPIEWMITAPHGHAGLKVNREFASSLAGLYACGEVASAQAFIRNLACSATSGATAGENAAEYARGSDSLSIDPEQLKQLREFTYSPLKRKGGIEPDHVLLSLQEAMIPYSVILIQHKERLSTALSEIEYIRDNLAPLLYAYDPHYLRMAHEVANMVLVAELQLRSTLMRTESRFALREDYPYTDNLNWLKWINAKKDGNSMRLFTEDVPIEKYRVKPERDKALHRLWQTAERIGIIKIKAGEVVWA